MRFRRAKKKFDVRILAIGLLAAIFIPAVVGGFIDPMAGFGIAGDRAKFYIAGVRYDGIDHMSKSSVASAGGVAFTFSENVIGLDMDGEIGTYPEQSGVDVVWAPIIALDTWTGILPSVRFQISDTLQLLDSNGVAIDSGYTYKETTTTGEPLYIYEYATTLTIKFIAGSIADTPITEEKAAWPSLPSASVNNVKITKFSYRGTGFYPVYGLPELGVFNDIQALLSIDFPNVENWDFNWEADVTAVGESYKSTQTSEVYGKDSWESYIEDTYPEVLVVTKSDYTINFNINQAIQRTHSVNGRINLYDSGDKKVGPIGVSQGAIPGAYDSYYAAYAWTDQRCTWDILEPTLTYDLKLQISAIDTTDYGTEDPPPEDPPDMDWKSYFTALSIEESLVLAGGIITAFVGLAYIARKRAVSGGAYY